MKPKPRPTVFSGRDALAYQQREAAGDAAPSAHHVHKRNRADKGLEVVFDPVGHKCASTILSCLNDSVLQHYASKLFAPLSGLSRQHLPPESCPSPWWMVHVAPCPHALLESCGKLLHSLVHLLLLARLGSPINTATLLDATLFSFYSVCVVLCTGSKYIVRLVHFPLHQSAK